MECGPYRWELLEEAAGVIQPPPGLPANTDSVEYTFARAAQNYQTTVRFRAHGVSPSYQLQVSPGSSISLLLMHHKAAWVCRSPDDIVLVIWLCHVAGSSLYKLWIAVLPHCCYLLTSHPLQAARASTLPRGTALGLRCGSASPQAPQDLMGCCVLQAITLPPPGGPLTTLLPVLASMASS